MKITRKFWQGVSHLNIRYLCFVLDKRSPDTLCSGQALNDNIRLVSLPDEHKVDIFIDSIYFTSYIYPDNMEKPVLYPLNSSSGIPVTRGFPIDPKPNERIDHPHQTGMWFNYGNVNGLDFWNN